MEGSLNVTIVGGGIAGLAAARVLRPHHSVTVVEKFQGGHEVGAALNLGPTATKIAEDLGFDRQRCKSVKATGSRSFNKNGKQIHYQDMAKFAENTQADWLFQHRADLWEEWLRLATTPSHELGIAGQPARMIWGVDVADVDVETGEVKLADGRTLSSDLVIGADGIKSIVRPLVVGEDEFRTARPSGASAFRFILTADEVREIHGNIDILDTARPVTLDVHLALDASNRSIVLYPCRNMSLINFVCIVPDTMLGNATTESWTADGDRKDLLRCFEDFGPYIRSFLVRATNVKLWQLRDQDPLPTYIKGRTVLIGDAAHAMTPHQGQGGTQSIEDAEAFQLFNTPDVGREAISDILQKFDRVRRSRASRIQNNTREMHERKIPEQMYKHNLYNRTYPGIQTCLARLDEGKDMIAV